MACLYRPTYTRTDPATGKKIKGKLAKWYGKYKDANGKEHRVPLSTNKQAAQIMLAERIKAVEMGRATNDPYTAHRQRPLAEHLADWEAELRSLGNTPRYVGMKVSRCRRVLDGCGFMFIADLSASKVSVWLSSMREKGVTLGCGKGTREVKAGQQTSNHYLGAIKQFSRWLMVDGRTDTMPLARLTGGNVETDRRHPRRPLTEAEIEALFRHLPGRPPIRGLDAHQRRMLYLCSLYTGLRAAELASLTPASFRLDDAPTVTVKAAHSKRRRLDVVPLHPTLVPELTAWLADKSAGDPVWPGKWASGFEAGVILRADLEAAGIDYKTDEGYADFHALRHTFVTTVIRAGATPKEAQGLARHSDIRLTMERYAHLVLLEMAAAILRMPHIPPCVQRAESA